MHVTVIFSTLLLAACAGGESVRLAVVAPSSYSGCEVTLGAETRLGTLGPIQGLEERNQAELVAAYGDQVPQELVGTVVQIGTTELPPGEKFLLVVCSGTILARADFTTLSEKTAFFYLSDTGIRQLGVPESEDVATLTVPDLPGELSIPNSGPLLALERRGYSGEAWDAIIMVDGSFSISPKYSSAPARSGSLSADETQAIIAQAKDSRLINLPGVVTGEPIGIHAADLKITWYNPEPRTVTFSNYRDLAPPQGKRFLAVWDLVAGFLDIPVEY